MSLLEVKGLQAGYGIVEVLFGIDLEVDAGELVVVLGANGAGKTTTLRAISGMIPRRGAVTFDGEAILGKRADEIVRKGIAHVPQGRGTITDLTVEENLRIGAYTRKDAEVDADIDRWFEMFPRLGERRDQAAGSMSGGEQQMLAIARAFMSTTPTAPARRAVARARAAGHQGGVRPAPGHHQRDRRGGPARRAERQPRARFRRPRLRARGGHDRGVRATASRSAARRNHPEGLPGTVTE